MGLMEIILLAAGAVIFLVSFCLPVKEEKLKEETRDLAAEEVKSLVSEELESVRGRLMELSEEEMKQQIEKSERSMERISNEKIMAVNEYSDTVLEEIHKNHEEVVFLYDMLKNKRTSISESYDEADQNLKELLQQVKDSEITVKEKLDEISKKQKELEKNLGETEAAVNAAEKSIKLYADQIKKGTVSRQAAAAEKTASEDKTVAEALKEQPKEDLISEFQPFVPEKIEVTPKKTRVKRTNSRERETRKPVADAAFSVENAGKKPMLSDFVEYSAVENNNGRILELHAAGKSNVAIARELGLGVGEVKLVIDLYEGLR